MTKGSETLVDGASIRVVRNGQVDWLTLNRPDRLNAIDTAMTTELFEYFGRLQNDQTCRVVVLRGAGRAFCAGLDLKAFASSNTVSAGDASLPGVVRRMRSCPQPIIALVRGAACGGGFSIALASDVRIASISARMNVAYVKIGVSGCELGTSFVLPRVVGSTVANELMLTGRFILANRALATGLVSEVVEEDQLDQAGEQLAAEMLAASAIGLRKTKETIERVGRVGDLDTALELEEQTQRECMRDPAFDAAVAAFTKKN